MSERLDSSRSSSVEIRDFALPSIAIVFFIYIDEFKVRDVALLFFWGVEGGLAWLLHHCLPPVTGSDV